MRGPVVLLITIAMNNLAERQLRSRMLRSWVEG